MSCVPPSCCAMRDSGGLPQLERGAVVTVGTFDGVHRGHRDILRRLRERADAARLSALVVTFRPHPLEVIHPEDAPLLLTPGSEQLRALADSGPLLVAAVPFTAALAKLDADEFVESVLIRRYRMRALVAGYDHGLGRGRTGDVDVLANLGGRLRFEVEVVPPTLDDSSEPISSSAIRAALLDGELGLAEAGLGQPYFFDGTVVPGQRRGRDLGYPTLNIALPTTRKLLPPDGVYAVRVRSRRGMFGGMMNLGARPTFAEADRTLEVHLFDDARDWYGEVVSVAFVRRLRDTVRFSGVEALVAQLARDAEQARVALTQA
jgi:riboflavin kinase / FMN adenylyltransferase